MQPSLIQTAQTDTTFTNYIPLKLHLKRRQASENIKFGQHHLFVFTITIH